MALVNSARVATANELENKVAADFDTLAEILPAAGKHMRLATLSLRSAFSVADANIEEFRNLRRSIVNDANTYRFKILPVAKQSTCTVKDFMDNFLGLSLNELLEIADDLKKDTKNSSELMTICKDMHMTISASFKKQQDKIDNVLSVCELQKKHFLAEEAKLNESADNKETWAFALSFVPGVNLIATPLLQSSAASARVEATAKGEEAQLAVNATFVIQNCLTGAITGYVEAMDKFAATFQLLAAEIDAFLGKLEKFQESEKKSFYKMCQAKAKKVATGCAQYLAMAIEAESDLMALPEGSDKNYVQEWLEKNSVQEKGTFQSRLLAIMGQSTTVSKALKDTVG